jgi:hypothetical protein
MRPERAVTNGAVERRSQREQQEQQEQWEKAEGFGKALRKNPERVTRTGFFWVRPAWARSIGFKSRMVKAVVAIAQGKGVRREAESEGSRRQIAGPRNTNFI